MTECEPTERFVVAKVACPELSVFVPSDAAPSLKITVPVGVPAPGATALTVAVKVTDWPKTVGFGDEASVVTLSALLTVCVRVEETFVRKFASPL